MFVDDALSACLCNNNTNKQMVCESVESLYIFLGYPGSIENPGLPAAIAIDKFLDRPLGEKRISLGTGLDFYHLCLFTPKEKTQ
jgi:hypothetical protein